MPTQEEPSTEPSNPAPPPDTRPLVYREYCYTVQIFAQPGDISWSGTYGTHPSIRGDSRVGDGANVKAGLGKDGRITGGSDIVAASDAEAIEQLNARYGVPNVNYRLLALDARGAVGLGEN